MKLFGWKSAGRDDSRPALDARRTQMFGDTLGTVPQTYREQVQRLYLRNAIAQRAVRMVAEGVGDAPLSAARDVLALVQARSGGQALTATLAAHLLLHGNAYVQVLTDARGDLVELFALRPERFAEDRLSVNRATFLAGAATAVPLVEVREDAA